KQYEAALAGARSPDDKTRALDALANYYEVRGQYNKAIGYRNQAQIESSKTEPPVLAMQRQLAGLASYVRAGRAAEANRILSALAARLAPPFTLFEPLGAMEIALEQRKPDEAEKAINAVEQGIKLTGFDILNTAVVRGRARLSELRSN